MDLSDVRKLSVTTIVLAGVLVLWLVFLALHDGGQFEWKAPDVALGWFGFQAWMWVCVGIMAVLATVIGLLSFALDQAPPGLARGKLRQVQCQDCKAVFMIHDAGNRPLTHQCPNCKALGVYTGQAPPVGDPPKASAPDKVIELGLTCHECNTGFKVTDTGVRPLKVTCPNCDSTGAIA